MPSFMSVEQVLDIVKQELDAPLKDNTKNRVSLLYACNASGKTRLSKLFFDQFEGQVLYYNAFTEDLFSWDNTKYLLKIIPKMWLFTIIQAQELESQIIENFKRLSGSKIEPAFNISGGTISFRHYTGDDNYSGNIKISRGEESVFVWSVFYTILDLAIENLNMSLDDRSTKDFDSIQYVVIDDPVSSMDDTRIITVALELGGLIAKSKNQLKFLITTHHPLFFNVLFNERKKKWDMNAYILSKANGELHLKNQGQDSPFAYHHVIISELNAAIASNNLKKYHFNLFRALLEKTANFLGYAGGWSSLLLDAEQKKTFVRNLNHYSHGRLSDLESNYLSEDDENCFKEAFRKFIKEFKWGSAIKAK